MRTAFLCKKNAATISIIRRSHPMHALLFNFMLLFMEHVHIHNTHLRISRNSLTSPPHYLDSLVLRPNMGDIKFRIVSLSLCPACIVSCFMHSNFSLRPSHCHRRVRGQSEITVFPLNAMQLCGKYSIANGTNIDVSLGQVNKWNVNKSALFAIVHWLSRICLCSRLSSPRIQGQTDSDQQNYVSHFSLSISWHAAYGMNVRRL